MVKFFAFGNMKMKNDVWLVKRNESKLIFTFPNCKNLCHLEKKLYGKSIERNKTKD